MALVKTKKSDDDLISVEEAAEVLGLRPKTVYNRKGGTESLLRVKMGRSVRLLRSEVLNHRESAIREARRVADAVYGR